MRGSARGRGSASLLSSLPSSVFLLWGILISSSLLHLGTEAETISTEKASRIEDVEWRALSPNSQVTLQVAFSCYGEEDKERVPDEDYNAERLCYRVKRQASATVGVYLVDHSPLGVIGHSNDGKAEIPRLERNLLKKVNRGQGADVYSMLHGKSKQNKANYTSLEFQFQTEDELQVIVEFRVYDDGVAFRYVFPNWNGDYVIEGEYTGFNMRKATNGWMQEYEKAGWGTPAYEYPYEDVPTAYPTLKGDGWSFPALFKIQKLKKSWFFVLLAEAGVTKDYCGTRLESPPTMDDGIYRIKFPSADEGNGVGDNVVRTKEPFSSPWRLIIGGDLKHIVQSSMVHHVSPPLDPIFEDDLSWIVPGLSTWSWFSQETGTPALQMEYIDSASDFGWPYVIVDANWDKWEDDEEKVKKLVRYGASKTYAVGVWLWYNSGGPHNVVEERPRNRMHESHIRRREFKKISSWGVKGVKVDFWGSDKQDRIQQYLDLLKDAAEYHLLVSLHGCTVPRGWSRQFPNLLTMESVRGAEYYKTQLRSPTAADHVLYVFTRNVVGPMDYTPLAFDAAYNRHKIAYSHSLALSVMFESALMAFSFRADSDLSVEGFRSFFARFPFVSDFLASLPTAWDETVFLDGAPNSYCILARRSGDNWWVAGISGDIGKPITGKLDWKFLNSSKTYRYWLIHSGQNATSLKEGMDYVDYESLKSKTYKLNPSDGFVMQFSALRFGSSSPLLTAAQGQGFIDQSTIEAILQPKKEGKGKLDPMTILAGGIIFGFVTILIPAVICFLGCNCCDKDRNKRRPTGKGRR